MIFANRISSSTSCSIWPPETSPPSSARDVLGHPFQSCNTSRMFKVTDCGLKSCEVILGATGELTCRDKFKNDLVIVFQSTSHGLELDSKPCITVFVECGEVLDLKPRG